MQAALAANLLDEVAGPWDTRLLALQLPGRPGLPSPSLAYGGQKPNEEQKPDDQTGASGSSSSREDDLPDWARKELAKVRNEAAGYRTRLRDAETKLSGAKSPEEFEAALTDVKAKNADHCGPQVRSPRGPGGSPAWQDTRGVGGRRTRPFRLLSPRRLQPPSAVVSTRPTRTTER